MKPRISYPSPTLVVLAALGFGVALLGCKAKQLNTDAAKIAVLYDEPIGCEKLGVVKGQGGGLTGAYAKPTTNQESAENDALNQAAEMGATHLLLHPEEVEQGDGRGPDYQDTQPAMAHGSGTGSTVILKGTAYRCSVASPDTVTMVEAGAGTAFAVDAAPTAISLAPLGTLSSITVYHRAPQPNGGDATETEVLVVEDQAQVEQVVESLQRVAADPMKYIPTHRVQITGELGTQSLLYGFGYILYAGYVYRLTDGVFEEVLRLRETSKGPDVETEPPPAETTSGGEAP